MHIHAQTHTRTHTHTHASAFSVPVLAVLSRGLLVAVVEVSDELRGLLLVPSHQLFELLELSPLFLLVALELLQALQRTQREVWGQGHSVKAYESGPLLIRLAVRMFSVLIKELGALADCLLIIFI